MGRRRRRGEWILLLIAVAGQAALMGCRGGREAKVVATAGRERLTEQELESRIPIQLNRTVGGREKQRLVEKWVEEELFHQEALRRKLEQDLEVAARISGATRDLLIAELLEREYREEPDVTEDEIRTLYEEHREDFVRDQPEIRARHILVKTKGELDRIWRRLRKGEPFGDVAREHSIDTSARDGGDLGYFTENQVDPSFWAACDGASKGRQVRESTRLGYHIIEVLDRREAGSGKSLLDVRSEIRRRIMAERRAALRQALLTELRGRIPWSVAEVLSDSGAEPEEAE